VKLPLKPIDFHQIFHKIEVEVIFKNISLMFVFFNSLVENSTEYKTFQQGKITDTKKD
jgi:hypothetical protein